VHVFNGQSKNLKKNGKGIYKVEEYFKNGEIKTCTIEGEWENDIFLRGKLVESDGSSRILTNTKNIEWSNMKSRQNLEAPKSEKRSKSKSKNKDSR
jgi:hypothetical protein